MIERHILPSVTVQLQLKVVAQWLCSSLFNRWSFRRVLPEKEHEIKRKMSSIKQESVRYDSPGAYSTNAKLTSQLSALQLHDEIVVQYRKAFVDVVFVFLSVDNNSVAIGKNTRVEITIIKVSRALCFCD